MIPSKFADIYKNEKVYFDKQYPDTNDCIVLDKQARDINVDLDDILKRQLSGHNEGGGHIGYLARSMSKTHLNNLYLQKTNKFTTLDCRNRIETLRQNQSASIFNEYATTADKNVLSESNKKQLAFVSIGAVVLLATLYVFTKAD